MQKKKPFRIIPLLQLHGSHLTMDRVAVYDPRLPIVHPGILSYAGYLACPPRVNSEIWKQSRS